MRYTRRMTLAQYLERHGESDAEFGRRAGLSRTEVWFYKTGKREPRATAIAAIEKATQGKVKARDLAA